MLHNLKVVTGAKKTMIGPQEEGEEVATGARTTVMIPTTPEAEEGERRGTPNERRMPQKMSNPPPGKLMSRPLMID